MINPNTTGKATTYSIISAACMAANPTCYADAANFRIAFENVPGAEEVTSGNTTRGIRILKQQIENGADDKGPVLATLCGAYIIERSLEEAAEVCADAVEEFPGEAAFNNRGVLRVLTGDLKGAHEDFDRARPAHLDKYIEDLMYRDVGLIANDNHSLLEAIQAKRSPERLAGSVAANSGIKIEDMRD